MKNKILELIKIKPKHYSILIKKNAELNQWVLDNSLIVSEKYPEMIYSALYKESNICQFGKQKSIARISDGWVGCGPAKVCECTRNNIAKKVSSTKIALPESEKIAANKKREETLLKEYGVRFNSQRQDVKKILSKPKLSDSIYALLSDRSWLDNEYNVKERSLVDIANELGVYYSTVGEYCRKHDFTIRQKTNYSMEEKIICDFLDSINVDYIRNDWNVLGNKEIDIFIPAHNIGIEVNGLYWHSFNPYCAHTTKIEDKNRHIDKTQQAKEKGIDLIQITDYEVNNKLEIVKSIIISRLGKANKIYARKCSIKEVPKYEEKNFLDKNHIQGFSGSSYAIGLYLETTLVMVMTFGKSRYSSKADIEMIRMCNALGNTVVGGAEKLFKHARQYFKNKSIISYCDRSKFTGLIYSRLGFTSESYSPGYFWTDGTHIISRYKCQHKNLSKWLPTYDSSKSESENLFLAKYRRYWDCGQQSWLI